MADYLTHGEFQKHAQEVDDRAGRLEKLTNKLRTDQVHTSERLEAVEAAVQDLDRKVDGIPALIADKLDDQTYEIVRSVDEKTQALTGFVTDKLVESARQWPAGAIVLTTAVLALLVAVIAGAILHAAGLV
jgi:putative heme iron utilization protein